MATIARSIQANKVSVKVEGEDGLAFELTVWGPKGKGCRDRGNAVLAAFSDTHGSKGLREALIELLDKGLSQIEAQGKPIN